MKSLRLILVLALYVSGIVAMYATNYYILSVGIADYPGEKSDLHNCCRDAKSVISLWEKQNINGEYSILLDKEATLQNIISHGAKLFQKAEPDDVVIFYFSGHGDKQCLVPYDANPKNVLRIDDIRLLLQNCKAKRQMLWIDACKSGALRVKQPTEAPVAPSSSDKELLFFLSSRNKQFSQDSKRWTNSLFTFFLVGGLKGGADANQDRIITAREIFEYVHKRVKEKSEGKQIPVMWGKFPDDMIIMDWRK